LGVAKGENYRLCDPLELLMVMFIIFGNKYEALTI
jgi:hypothetical protein